MKILQVTSRTEPARGGLETHTAMISKKLAERGHEVTLVAFNSVDQMDCGYGLCYEKPFLVTNPRPKSLPSEEWWGPVRVLRFGSRAQLFSYYWSPEMLHWLVLHLDDFDIVHTHCFRFSNNEFAALALSMNKRDVPLVFTCHDATRLDYMGSFGLLLDAVYRRTAGRRLVNKAKRLVALTESNAEEYVKYLFADPSKIRVVPNGIEYEKYQSLPDPKTLRARLGNPGLVVLFLGRFIGYKNPDKVVNAFKMISRDYSDSALLMVGKDYGSLAYCQKLASGRVLFLENASEKEKLEALALADVCVIPSSYEGFGIVALEAQAAGVPVISTKRGGLQHLVLDGRTGIQIESPSPNNIERAVRRLFEDSDMRKSMGREGRRFSKDFSWESVADSTERVYIGASQ